MDHTYPIKTKEFHEAALGRNKKHDSSIDASENGLSSWGSDNMASYHLKALEVIANGMMDMKLCLFKGDLEINASLQQGDYGLYWDLNREGKRQAGLSAHSRPFLSQGPKSRAQKHLGLHERRILKPVKDFFIASCAGLGSPVMFHTQM